MGKLKYKITTSEFSKQQWNRIWRQVIFYKTKNIYSYFFLNLFWLLTGSNRCTRKKPLNRKACSYLRLINNRKFILYIKLETSKELKNNLKKSEFFKCNLRTTFYCTQVLKKHWYNVIINIFCFYGNLN